MPSPSALKSLEQHGSRRHLISITAFRILSASAQESQLKVSIEESRDAKQPLVHILYQKLVRDCGKVTRLYLSKSSQTYWGLADKS